MKLVSISTKSENIEKEFSEMCENILRDIRSGLIDGAIVGATYKDGTFSRSTYSEYGKPYVLRLIGILEVTKKYLLGFIEE